MSSAPVPTVHAALARPIAEAEGLSGAAYGAAALEAERDRLFAGGWVPVAVAARLPTAGDALAIDLAGWPLLLVRGRDGRVNAFFNICRHRAMRLVSQDAHLSTVIRCPWHSWSYGFDGRLIATPHIDGYNCGEPGALDRDALGLKAVRVCQWLDFLFVDISGTAPPLDTHLAPLSDFLLHDYAGMVHVGYWRHDYPGNWKIAMEGAIEDYHIPWGHPQLTASVATRQAVIDAHPQIFAAASTPVIGQAPTTADIPVFPRRRASDLAGGVINVFPTGVIGYQDDHLMLGLMLPDGPARTRVEFNYYFPADALVERFAAHRAKMIAGWEEVAPQDDAYVAGVQANAAIRDAAGVSTRFAPAWEGAVLSFQRSISAALG